MRSSNSSLCRTVWSLGAVNQSSEDCVVQNIDGTAANPATSHFGEVLSCPFPLWRYGPDPHATLPLWTPPDSWSSNGSACQDCLSDKNGAKIACLTRDVPVFLQLWADIFCIAVCRDGWHRRGLADGVPQLPLRLLVRADQRLKWTMVAGGRFPCSQRNAL